MPANWVQTCREVLENKYRDCLRVPVSSSLSDFRKTNQPVWLTVSDDDLTTEMEDIAPDAAGLLLDPEIGLMSYVLPFKTNVRKQIKRALGLRSRLSVEQSVLSSKVENEDPNGAWRILLIWLVSTDLKDRWVDEIMSVRRETGFSEEITFDAIFIEQNATQAVEEYGFPRLLFSTREIFSKQHFEQIAGWMSADQTVGEVLSDFATNFNSLEQKALADEIVAASERLRTSIPKERHLRQVPSEPRTIHSVRISNFRNLHDVSFDFGPQNVTATIVHGPNGTGKSSLSEALSLALFGSSHRYRLFSDRNAEKDVSAVDRAQEYLNKYLTSVDRTNGTAAAPKIALDDDPLTKPELLSSKDISDADLAMGATILTQEGSLEFTRMGATQLAARVLRGYSDLADAVEEFAESRIDQSNAERQNFLRGLRLPAAITRLDTAYARIARLEIDSALPPFPRDLVTWFDSLSITSKAVGIGIPVPQGWRSWGDDGARSQLANQLGSSSNSPDKIVRDLQSWLERFNELVTASETVLNDINSLTESVDLENVMSKLSMWSRWLEKRKDHREPKPGKDSPLVQQLQKLQTTQNEVLEQGRILSDRYDHLTKVEVFVKDRWSKHHPDECPTCGTEHHVDGGVQRVIEQLRTQTAEERQKLRMTYSSLKTQIAQLLRRMSESDEFSECPVSPDDQSNLAALLSGVIGPGTTLSELIVDKNRRESLINLISNLRRIPSTPAVLNAAEEAERAGNRLISKLQEAEKIFETPSNWQPVRAKLTETLAGIVERHLPNTIEKLWCELVLNLTSAPWLLLDRPHIRIEPKRGAQSSTVLVRNRLARYIFNEAENHTLGLAWFFTQYLTRGRFYNACIVMDDPAHELDQTSYRDLCRFWETLMRLHRVYGRALRLIIMLNQENRALQAARATAGILTVFEWEREQGRQIISTSIVGEGFYAPQPLSLFKESRPS